MTQGDKCRQKSGKEKMFSREKRKLEKSWEEKVRKKMSVKVPTSIYMLQYNEGAEYKN